MAEAEAELRFILGKDAQNLPALILLSVVSFRLNHFSEAEELLLQVLVTDPKQADALGLLGVIRKSAGNWPGALEAFQRLISLGHRTPDTYNHLGSCLLELGDPISAGTAFKKAIELDRDLAHSYYNLGVALKQAGGGQEVFSTFKRAIELNPSFQDSYIQLWQQMRQLLNWQEGLPLLERGFRRFPDSVEMMVILATTYGKVGQAERAKKLFEEAAKLSPLAGPPYAHWLQEEGEFESSIPLLLDSVRRLPAQGQAYYNLAIAKQFELDGRSLPELIQPLLTSQDIDAEGRMFLHYALAKTYDQARDYERAMHNYHAANAEAYALYNPTISPDFEAEDAEFETLKRLFSESTIKAMCGHGSASQIPIFIVGMIRTGTTLLDQILASHHMIKSAGEQPFWHVNAGRMNRLILEGTARGEDFQSMEHRYLEALDQAVGESPRVTDKMPTNFNHIGLMSVIFPKSKFIHIRRSPLDTCVSIYTTFLGTGTQFAYNQRNIVAYYRAYMRTMAHWRSVISPEQMIEIDYEDLVTKKELVVRHLLNFCELPWDEACLDHAKNAGQVSTPSLWAVRQPVNTASVERWRKFEPWLGELLELRDLKHPAPLASIALDSKAPELA
jgi:tetratricopeptide (TPR) repeat protein